MPTLISRLGRDLAQGYKIFLKTWFGSSERETTILEVCRTFHTARAFLSGQESRMVGYKHCLASLSTFNNILTATSAAFFTPFRVCKSFRLKAMQTSVHSPCTAFKPRNMNCRNPITCLIIPKTGSTVDLRLA